MGKGRAPCCDKDKVKRGPWSPAEDLRLITFIQKHGHDNWRALPRLADESKESSLTSSSSSSSITSSCGKRNLETENEDQWDNIGTVTKKPCSREEFAPATNKDFKPELSKQLSSSSISSDNSNMTNSSQVDVPNPENYQAGSLFDFVESLYDGYNNISEEVNKPEMSDHTAFDIPFESDLEFWNMLDSLGSSFQSDGTQLQMVEGNHGSNLGEEMSKELTAENNKWLHYLENEVLGVEVTKDENHNNLSKDAAEPLVSEMYDLLLKPEAEMGMGHYLNHIQSSNS
ncbi:hypothetical protein COLO4_05148 [Corchorus olitorius]|uniref:Uncharacterized protein n=1 Tax=Corchorus olitorius TaxID=93759 RepID=A0A1R3KRU5_9ROSI|nr:hypothetical protein COLO4_05148 [Corchorus olitorius]